MNKILFKKIIYIFGVFFASLFLTYIINLAIYSFYSPQDITDFCPDAGELDRLYDNKGACETAGGNWKHWTTSHRGYQYEGDLCDFSSASCSKDFSQAKQKRDLIVLALLVIIGLIFMFAKVFILKNKINFLSNLFIPLSVILVILGIVRFWFDVDSLIGGITFWISIVLFGLLSFGREGGSGLHF